MIDTYVLNDAKEAVPCADHMKAWEAFGSDEARRVGLTTVGPYRISTVFLVIDHGFGDGPPKLFETMVFGLDGGEEDMDRCSTWAEAEAMHAGFVKRYEAKL